MISWELFRNKRKLDLPQWFDNLGISSKDYDKYCTVCKSLGVNPMPASDFIHTLKDIGKKKRADQRAARLADAAKTGPKAKPDRLADAAKTGPKAKPRSSNLKPKIDAPQDQETSDVAV